MVNTANTRCDFCSKEFYKKPSQIKRSIKNFCSAKCQHRARRSGVWVKCFICKKLTYKQRKDLRNSWSNKFFCSRQCSNKWHGHEFTGDKHPNWIYGRFVYKNILLKTGMKRRCFLCGNVNKQVLVTHHIDKNRNNNKPRNLLWLCYNCHHLVHNYKEESLRLTKKLKSHASKKVQNM